MIMKQIVIALTGSMQTGCVSGHAGWKPSRLCILTPTEPYQPYSHDFIFVCLDARPVGQRPVSSSFRGAFYPDYRFFADVSITSNFY